MRWSGMGTLFAGILRAPMTSVLMIFETTHDYAVIVPLMISNMVSFFISSRLQPTTHLRGSGDTGWHPLAQRRSTPAPWPAAGGSRDARRQGRDAVRK